MLHTAQGGEKFAEELEVCSIHLELLSQLLTEAAPDSFLYTFS